jgi:hypothetical protein
LAGATLDGTYPIWINVNLTPGENGTYIDTTKDSVTNPDYFNSSDYDTPGTYTSELGTMTVSVTPEPPTTVLWLTGIVLMIVTRKRIAHLLRLDTGTPRSLSPY